MMARSGVLGSQITDAASLGHEVRQPPQCIRRCGLRGIQSASHLALPNESVKGGGNRFTQDAFEAVNADLRRVPRQCRDTEGLREGAAVLRQIDRSERDAVRHFLDGSLRLDPQRVIDDAV
jgi:hypothetical protein